MEWNGHLQAPTVLTPEKIPIPSELKNMRDPEPGWTGQIRKNFFPFQDSKP
jgi:hypothetical protein